MAISFLYFLASRPAWPAQNGPIEKPTVNLLAQAISPINQRFTQNNYKKPKPNVDNIISYAIRESEVCQIGPVSKAR